MTPTTGPTESQAQGSWRGHAGAGFVGAAPVPGLIQSLSMGLVVADAAPSPAAP